LQQPQEHSVGWVRCENIVIIDTNPLLADRDAEGMQKLEDEQKGKV